MIALVAKVTCQGTLHLVKTDSHYKQLGVADVRRTGLGAVVALLALGAIACGGDDDGPDASGGDRLQVVASFYPVAEAATRVGGDRVEVTNLTPPGVEPHDFELAPDDVDRLEDADVVLYLGEGFQPAVAEIAERQDGAVDLMTGIDLEAGASEALEAEEAAGEEGEAEEGEGDEHGDVDPHFWLDPTLLSAAVGEIEAALTDAAPDDAATFAANARAYEDELAGLDDEMAAGLADCERDEIVTSHAAFFYLARRYGLTQLPIAGLSPESEPDADRLAELADQIDDGGITTVFYETLVSPDVAETLADEADVETAVLNPIEGLTDDDVDAGADYTSIMRDNLAALRDALGCT
jgi:zinc transport system substrate-binding protein